MGHILALDCYTSPEMGHSIPQGDKVFVRCPWQWMVASPLDNMNASRRRRKSLSLMMVLAFGLRKPPLSPNLGDGLNDAIGR